MYSPEIARQLQARGHEIQSIQGDRPEPMALDDERIVEQMSVERRGVVTNNVKHFMPAHSARIAAGKTHYGLVFSSDKSMPRSQAAIGLWVKTLDRFLNDHPAEDALKDRVQFLAPER